MGKGIEYTFPSKGDLRSDGPALVKLEAESMVAAFLDSRKPDEIREVLDPQRPGVMANTMARLMYRARSGRLVVAKAWVGSKRLPVAIASSLEAPELRPHEYTRQIITATPLLRNIVSMVPIAGHNMLKKPNVVLDPMHIDPDLQDNADLIRSLGEKVLEAPFYTPDQVRVGSVPYKEVKESVGDQERSHFMPEDTLQPKVMQLHGFEIKPIAKPYEDTELLGPSVDPLIMQPYQQKTLLSHV